MSYLLEILGRGLDREIPELLDRYYWSPQTRNLEDLQAEVSLHPDNAELQGQCGVACLHAGRHNEAIEHLQHACQADGQRVSIRLALAATYESMGRTTEALAELMIANEVSPGMAAVLFSMGFC